MIGLAERGWIPDSACRWGVRRLCRQRLASLAPNATDQLVDSMIDAPLAVSVDDANRQHYELPAEFFEIALGKYLKYSCGYWPDGVETLDDAEAAMLELSTQRAAIEDGMEILELGCGWGSWSLWLAEHFPNARILSLSNSNSQRAFIEERAARRGLKNLTVMTCDMNAFEVDRRFDRVVSIEMFEHMRNYHELMRRVHGWLKPDGRLFVHVFCHRDHAYTYEIDGEADWMARYFFTGGLMPSFDLMGRFPERFEVEQSWRVDGRHYERTANAWLSRVDAQRHQIEAIFRETYGDEAPIWLQRWRLFFIACAESFGYAGGDEWLVGHYLLRPTGSDRD